MAKIYQHTWRIIKIKIAHNIFADILYRNYIILYEGNELYMNEKDKCKEKKEQQLNNLTNLVENHTRTERHLEQYSDIGSYENKEIARNKQDIREYEMHNLKEKIIEGDKKTPEEMIEDTRAKYQATGRYVANNYDNIPEENLKNIQVKQKHRKMQIENFEDNQ